MKIYYSYRNGICLQFHVSSIGTLGKVLRIPKEDRPSELITLPVQ